MWIGFVAELSTTRVILESEINYNMRNEADNHVKQIDKHLDISNITFNHNILTRIIIKMKTCWKRDKRERE